MELYFQLVFGLLGERKRIGTGQSRERFFPLLIRISLRFLAMIMGWRATYRVKIS